jgi:hypothetical protein
MGRRARATVVVVVAGLAATIGVAACVLADPPAQIPVPPIQRPEIERELCSPGVTQILETWPTEFDVPIQAFDTTSSIQWQAFLDYDVTQSHPIARGQLDADPAQDAGVRLLNARLPAPPMLQDCHIVEILVARSFPDIHTPDTYGGDSVTWFYSPTGSLDGCPVYDAGPRDAGTEGAVDGGGGDAADAEGGGG